MAQVLLLPKLGITMEEGVLARWFKQVGESIDVGEPLFEIETDKSVLECESDVKGTLLKILLEEGQQAPVATPIAVVGEPHEDPDAALGALKPSAGAAETRREGPAGPDAKAAAPDDGSAAPGDDSAVTPRARRLAKELGISLDSVPGTGDGGRIGERDVIAYAESLKAGDGEEGAETQPAPDAGVREKAGPEPDAARGRCGAKKTHEEYLARYGREKLLTMYLDMCLIREFEENIKYLYQRSLATGAMHLSVGEEAAAVGSCQALRPDDVIFTGHRGHGHNIAKGASIPRMVAELMARQDGFCKGRGGSMHILDVSSGALGAQGIVGAQIPIAAGAAFAARLKGLDRVAVAFFGDGSTNIGAFHEGVNIAAVMKLPVVFVCTNNGYAVTTPASYSIKAESIAARAAAYGIEGVRADGCDVLAVCDVVSKAVEKARAGLGPTLIELEAYRWYGHFVGDPCDYRSREEERRWRENRDPIRNYGAWLIEGGVCTAEEVADMDDEAKRRIDEANAFAERSPQPNFEEMAGDVYFVAKEGR